MRASWFGSTTLRSVSVVLGTILSVTPAFCGYVARLWFENLTKGTSNAGALLCDPGDEIAIKYFFRADDQTGNTEKWGTFQATIILDGKTIMTDAQANTWASQIGAVLTPAAHFPIKVYHQPDYGDMYDNAIDPADTNWPKVATKGLYALIGVAGSREPSWNFNRTLFKFNVAANAAPGEELHWAFPNRLTGTGLSTRILDYQGASVLITDNYLKVADGTPTTTTVVASPNPARVGQLVTFTATVSPVPDGGTVQFEEDGVPIGGPVAVIGGVASLNRTYATRGPRTMTAEYSGTNHYSQSQGSTVLSVLGHATSTLVTAVPNPVERQYPCQLTATISPVDATGVVQFKADGVNLSGPVEIQNGSARLTHSFPHAGNVEVSAVYGGSEVYEGSSGAASVVVLKTPTTCSVSATPNTVERTKPVTVTAVVTPAPESGHVEFRADGDVFAIEPVVGGVASASLSVDMPGQVSLEGRFTGTPDYGASTGFDTLTVTKTPTSTAVTATPNPAVTNEPVTITADVLPTPDQGLVTLLVNGVAIGSVTPGGSMVYSFAQYGSYEIEARYSGSERFDASSSLVRVGVLPLDQWVEDPITGSTYLVPSIQGTWPELQRYATQLGGDLVSIGSAAEMDFLRSVFFDAFDLFVGLRDVKPGSGKWRWESGDPVGYVNWDGGQPGSGEVAVMAQGKAGAWQTRSISYVAHGIVERVASRVYRLEVPSWGSPVTTEPLVAGKNYVIEVSGEWVGNNHAWRADAEFFRDGNGVWHETAPGDGLDLLVNGARVDWLGTSDGAFFRPHTFSPNHVYRYEIAGEGQPVTLSVDTFGASKAFGALQVRVFERHTVGAYQGDSPWPTLYGDSASTHNSPWAIAPQSQSDLWTVSGIGEPLAISAKGDIYCSSGSTLQRVSGTGQPRGSIEIPGEWLTAVAIGVDGTVFALTDGSLTALSEDLQVLWSLSRGGHGNLVIDRYGVLYHTSVAGDNRVFSVWSNGIARWAVTLDAPLNGSGLSVGADERLYVTTELGDGNARVYRLSLDGEVERYSTVPGYYASAPVLSPDGRMYVTTSRGLYAFGPSGELLWTYPIPAWANGKPTLLANGRVSVVGGWSPGVRVAMYQFDPDGTMLWKLPETIQYVWASGSDALGGSWNVGWSQDLWLGSFLGSQAWSRSFGPAYSIGGPIMGADGTLYQHVNNVLHAIGPGQKVQQQTMMLLDDAYSADGGSVALRARLVLGRSGGGVSGRIVSFEVNGVWVGNALTDRLGYAVAPYAVGPGEQFGRHEIKAVWVGDDQFSGSEAVAGLWVDQPVSVIQGQVFLELWQPPSQGMTVTYEVLEGGGVVVSSGWTTLGPAGAYRIEVQQSGATSLRFKGSHWLSRKVDGLVLHPSTPVTVGFMLNNGDVDGNNQVGLNDMNLVFILFNSDLPSEADLNGSGKVDIADLSIVMINFGKAGT